MEKQLISVIVPVYKVEQYLCRCADSVLSQTHRDLELILVDDGSPDGSGAICDRYAEKDSRVHVIHKENGGLSSARNAGLDYLEEHSESQWLFFLDSDDWIHEKTLEVMLSACQESAADICTSGDYNTCGESRQVTEAEMQWQVCSSGRLFKEKTILMTASCGKLFKRALFQNIRFPLGKLHEDEFTTYRVLFSVEKQCFVPAPFYAYFSNPGSIMRVDWNPRRLHVWEAFRQQVEFFDGRGEKDLADLCLRRFLENASIQRTQILQLENPGEALSYVPMMEKKIRSLLKEAKRRKCLDFDEDFPLLIQFYPLRTRLQMYARAADRRIRRLLCRK